VLEKEFHLKYILNVMGCRPLPYWLGTFIFDYIAYLITVIIFYILVIENEVKFLKNYLNTLTLILAVFGADLIVYTYLCGYLFKKSNSAFKSFPIINFFVSYSIPWILTNLFEDSDVINNTIQIIMFFSSPFYVLDRALTSVNSDFSLTKTLF